MRLLLSAYSCLPGGGSEPGIGWNWAKSIASHGHSVTIITRSVNRAKLEAHMAQHPDSRISFLFCDLDPWIQRVYRLPMGNYVYYHVWQRLAVNVARGMHANQKFDRVQHITWGSFRVPSYMGSLTAPFIFGPVAGGEDTPPKLRRGLGPRGRLSDALRRLSGSLLALWMGSTYAAAETIVATTDETRNKIPLRFRHKTIICQAVGIDPSEYPQLSQPLQRESRVAKGGPLQLLFVGRLMAWKGVHLLIEALAQLTLEGRDVQLTIIGSGPDKNRLVRLAAKLAVESKLTWIPWMPREAVLESYSKYDLFAFTSLHDSGGTAVLEAMVHGLPVLCLDLGGPGVLVSKDCGSVIFTSGKTQTQVVAAIAESLKDLIAAPDRLDVMSHKARARVAGLTWQANLERVHRGLTQNS